MDYITLPPAFSGDTLSLLYARRLTTSCQSLQIHMHGNCCFINVCFLLNFCMSFHMDTPLEFFCIADAFKYYGGCADQLRYKLLNLAGILNQGNIFHTLIFLELRVYPVLHEKRNKIVKRTKLSFLTCQVHSTFINIQQGSMHFVTDHQMSLMLCRSGGASEEVLFSMRESHLHRSKLTPRK